MKLYISILTVLVCQIAIGQKPERFRKSGIYRADITYVTGKTKTYATIYYDSLGRNVKNIYIEDKERDHRTITWWEYLTDSLVSKKTEDVYDKKKLITTNTSSWSYTFDEKKRVIAKISEYSDAAMRTSKEVYTYTGDNRGDTVFFYDNDTAIWVENSFTPRHQRQENLSLKKISVYSYNGNQVVREDCCYPNSGYDRRCCRTFINRKSDTLDINIEKYRGIRGHILDSTETILSDSVLKKDGIVYCRKDRYGEIYYYEFTNNEKGFVDKQITRIVHPGGKTEIMTTTWKYYYRQPGKPDKEGSQ